MKKEMGIVFMGTPEFAVESLKILLQNNKNVLAVITSPDKPAGRGQKISKSAVKIFAEEQGLKILQPTNLKSPEFLQQLKKLNADLQIVVAFRMLPESVWNMPKYGTFNLHASLLPNYRGAAPINWAIINAEKVTGLTTFFLQKEIDTGDIIFQQKVLIDPDETAGELHDRMMNKGAELVLKTVEAIESGEVETKAQNELINGKFPDAPKIFKEDCKINWNKALDEVHDFIRGLSPYPAAWSEIENLKNNKITSFKLYRASKEKTSNPVEPGQFTVEDKKIKVGFPNGNLIIEELQLSGKKRMSAKEFLNGVDLEAFRIH